MLLRFPQLSSAALRTPLFTLDPRALHPIQMLNPSDFAARLFDAPLSHRKGTSQHRRFSRPIAPSYCTGCALVYPGKGRARPSCRGCALARPSPGKREPGPLLGSSEEAQDNPRGHPVIVLMYVRPKRSPVVVGIEQTDFKAPGWLDIQSPTQFK
jgi:hypothetical protein